ncbi:conserved hypothetical protein [Coccidioides posadasii str. Silveira]|uniref:Uncharacterized protein n=2 Tax=Coccidioides posadasii TaxID=199306 RepID=E9D9C5_COCPS|nr:conserved hypothetical protein [Coccidioides posadasii str. Silveira]KMM70071.1 hypothetical protein CPAG_06383 [Coccidioides posadasii RMSCC 3488]
MGISPGRHNSCDNRYTKPLRPKSGSIHQRKGLLKSHIRSDRHDLGRLLISTRVNIQMLLPLELSTYHGAQASVLVITSPSRTMRLGLMGGPTKIVVFTDPYNSVGG